MNQQASIEELKECREAFERDFAKNHHLVLVRNGNGYDDWTADWAWKGYQAAWNRRADSRIFQEATRDIGDITH